MVLKLHGILLLGKGQSFWKYLIYHPSASWWLLFHFLWNLHTHGKVIYSKKNLHVFLISMNLPNTFSFVMNNWEIPLNKGGLSCVCWSVSWKLKVSERRVNCGLVHQITDLLPFNSLPQNCPCRNAPRWEWTEERCCGRHRLHVMLVSSLKTSRLAILKEQQQSDDQVPSASFPHSSDWRRIG